MSAMFYFMDLVSTPAIKKNVNFEKRTNIGFDIYYSRFMDQNNPE